MNAQIEQLYSRWNGLMKGHNKKPKIRNLVFEKLVANYSQKTRAYHNLTHLTDCFKEFDECEEFIECLDWLELGLFFHDAVYDTHAKNNEEKSIMLMDELLLVHLPPYDLGRAGRIILATKHDKIPEYNDEKLAVCIDLAIFGKNWPEYLKYSERIRKEYSWVEKSAYCSGRAKVLTSFLNREKIYPHKFFEDKYEKTARENLTSEIGLLRMENLNYFSEW